MRKYLIPAVLALLLSACGGGNNNGSNAVTSGTSGMVDAFYALVNAQFGTPSDTTEPGAIDAIAATMPDNTEPVAM